MKRSATADAAERPTRKARSNAENETENTAAFQQQFACYGVRGTCHADKKITRALDQRQPPQTVLEFENKSNKLTNQGTICDECAMVHCKHCFAWKAMQGIRCELVEGKECFRFVKIEEGIIAEKCSVGEFIAFRDGNDPLKELLLPHHDAAQSPAQVETPPIAEQPGRRTAEYKYLPTPIVACGNALVAFFSILVGILFKDEDVGEKTVEDVFAKLRSTGHQPSTDKDNVTYCDECQVRLHMAFFKSTDHDTLKDVCPTCVQLNEAVRKSRALCCSYTDEELDLVYKAAKDLGVLDQTLVAPARPTAEDTVDAIENFKDAFTVEMLQVFDDCSGIVIYKDQACPIAPARSKKGIQREDLLEELKSVAQPKSQFDNELLQFEDAESELVKEWNEALDAGASKEHILELGKKQAEAMLDKSFDPADKSYSTLHLYDDSPALHATEKKYLSPKKFGGRGFAMAKQIRLFFAEAALLILIGCMGGLTHFHIDRTKARNTAWAVDWKGDGEDLTEISLARWTFIHPVGIRKAELFMKKKYAKKSKGFNCSTADKIFLSKKEAMELKEYVGDHPEEPGVPLVTIYEQKHGETVAFPAGYLHQVETCYPCVKFANDLFDVEDEKDLARYVTVGRLISYFMPSPEVGADYMAAVNFVMTVLSGYAEGCPALLKLLE